MASPLSDESTQALKGPSAGKKYSEPSNTKMHRNRRSVVRCFLSPLGDQGSGGAASSLIVGGESW